MEGHFLPFRGGLARSGREESLPARGDFGEKALGAMALAFLAPFEEKVKFVFGERIETALLTELVGNMPTPGESVVGMDDDDEGRTNTPGTPKGVAMVGVVFSRGGWRGRKGMISHSKVLLRESRGRR